MLDTTIINIGSVRQDTIYTKEHQRLAFADDLTLITKAKKELVRITKMVMERGSEGYEEYPKITTRDGRNYEFE